MVGEALASDLASGRLSRRRGSPGRLNHPNIVAVHDIGVYEGAPYVVTELLQGETLRDRLNRGPVPVAQALEWAVQIAHALAAASGHGIVHRDLKPDNVFLTRTGQVKLLDFGIAKATTPVTASRGLFDPTISPSGSSTRTGGVLGTPGYMSPEQVRGEQVDSRSDVFALGAILYELLSGQRAFKGGSVVESGYSILHDEPPPLPPSAPPDVAQVVVRCLAKDTEQRFQSARDVAFSLEAMRANRTVTPALPQQPSKGRVAGRLRRAAPLRAGALLLGLATLLWGAPPAPESMALRPSGNSPQRGSVSAARFAPTAAPCTSAPPGEEAHPRSTPPRSTPPSLGHSGWATRNCWPSPHPESSRSHSVRASSISSMRGEEPWPACHRWGERHASWPPTSNTPTGRPTAPSWQWPVSTRQGADSSFRSARWCSDPPAR